MEDIIDSAMDAQGGEVKLTGKQAKKDEALWTDEHTSDEEEFDPESPEDLATQTQKEEAEEEEDNGEPVDQEGDEDEDEGDEEEEDDSIVNDEIEDQCKDHGSCVQSAKAIHKLLVSLGKTPRFGGDACVAFLAEAVCDNYQ